LALFSRDRMLDDAGLRLVWDIALDGVQPRPPGYLTVGLAARPEPVMALAIQLLMLTLTRRNEVAGARKVEFDLDAAPLQAGYRPEAEVDKTLMERARAEGKTIHGFETADRQLRLIAGMSEEAQIAYLNNYVRYGDQIVPKLDQTVAAWLKGDAAEVGRLNRVDTRDIHEDVHRAALIVRNADWTDQIETMMKGSGSAFVAVGVAHLADQDSVIDMLKAHGFTVERL